MQRSFGALFIKKNPPFGGFSLLTALCLHDERIGLFA